MKKILTILSAFILTTSVFAYEGHKIWDQILQTYVDEAGRVNYGELQKNKKMLEGYLSYLSNETPDKSWSREKTMAYWINAYNAFTVKLILESYPLRSIMDVNEGKAWDLEFIELGGKMYTLNKIEHDILRKKYQDARIHFAVNCASISCPKLHNRAFTEDNLESLLDEMAGRYVNNQMENTIAAKSVEISELFKWYASDFTKNGSIIDFLNKYATTKIDASAKIAYKNYNWNLNTQ